ncbi:MAG: hypothetical protein IE909_15610, partial [Campylobacterales bacterium]|nr:hypothetical protein [Campylobacterales bacterium]
VEIMQKICEEFKLSLDEFVNEDLYIKHKGHRPVGTTVEEPTIQYEHERDALLKTIEAQKETIAAMKITIDTLLQK